MEYKKRDKLGYALYSILNINYRAVNDSQLEYHIMFQSISNPDIYITAKFKPKDIFYDTNKKDVLFTMWDIHERIHTEVKNTTRQFIWQKFKHGYWVIKTMHTVNQSYTRVTEETPFTILYALGNRQRRYGIVATPIYHAYKTTHFNKIHQNQNEVKSRAIFRRFIKNIPFYLNRLKLKRVHRVLAFLPPSYGFLGGINYQHAQQHFQSERSHFET